MQDWHPALEAHKEILNQARNESNTHVRAWVWDRYSRYGAGAAAPSMTAFDHQIEDLLASDTITLSVEMQDLAEFALLSFNRAEEPQPEDFMLDAGFLWLPRPFTVLDIAKRNMVWRAINWRLVPDIPVRDQHGEPQHEWGLRLMMYSHLDDKDDYPLPKELVEEARRVNFVWGYAHATTLPLSYFTRTEELVGEGDPKADWLTFLRVVMKLMQERIVERKEITPPRQQRRSWLRSVPEHIPLVSVIQLRRPRSQPNEDQSMETRHYTHRFMVSGHWRNQWYPSENRHKQRWISPYIKGPDDGELIIKERVWVWDK